MITDQATALRRPTQLSARQSQATGLTLDQIFATIAHHHPTRIAVQDGWSQLTYGQTDRQATQLASALVQGGVQLGDPLLVHCENHRHALVAQLAVLKAGGVCVPAPRTPYRGGLPAAAQQITARAVLCSRSTYDKDVRGIPSLALDDPATWRRIASAAPEPTLPRSAPEAAAYLLLGGDGSPTAHGRLIDHRSWIRSAADRSRRIGTEPQTVAVDEPPMSPAALAAMWWAFSRAGTFHTAPWQSDKQWPLTGGPDSAAVLTPADYAHHLANAPTDQPPQGSAVNPAAVVLIGGPCSRSIVARHFRTRPGTRLWAEFAPADGSVPWTAQELFAADANRPSTLDVGGPVPPVLLRVLGPAGETLPRHRQGELVAIGPSRLSEDVHRSGWYGYWTPENTLDLTGRQQPPDDAV